MLQYVNVGFAYMIAMLHMLHSGKPHETCTHRHTPLTHLPSIQHCHSADFAAGLTGLATTLGHAITYVPYFLAVLGK